MTFDAPTGTPETASTTALTHIAVQEQLDGKNVEWMEQVSDHQYLAGSSAE